MDIKMKKDCIEADYFYDLDKLTTNEITFFKVI